MVTNEYMSFTNEGFQINCSTITFVFYLFTNRTLTPQSNSKVTADESTGASTAVQHNQQAATRAASGLPQKMSQGKGYLVTL